MNVSMHRAVLIAVSGLWLSCSGALDGQARAQPSANPKAPPTKSAPSGKLEFEARPVDLFRPPLQVRSVAISRDGGTLVSGHGDYDKPGELVVWDVKTKATRLARSYGLGVRSVAFAPDGKLFAAGNYDGTLEVFDAGDLKLVVSWKDHQGPGPTRSGINGVAFSPDGKLLASGGLESTICLWDVAKKQKQRTLLGHTDAALGIAFSADGKLLVSAGRDSTVRVWNVADGTNVHTLTTGTACESIACSADGVIAAGDFSGNISLWSLESGESRGAIVHASDPRRRMVSALAFVEGGKKLLSGSREGTVKVWDMADLSEEATIDAHLNHVWNIALSADGKWFATAGEESLIKAWDTKTRKMLFELGRPQNPKDTPQAVVAVTWSPDGKQVASAHADHTVRLRDANDGKLAHVLEGPEDIVTSLAFSADGKLLAASSRDVSVRVWSAADGRLKATLSGHKSWVLSAAFSPDGKWLASGEFEGTIRLWDTTSWKNEADLTGHESSVRVLAFSPDRRHLLSGGSDQTLRLWDIAARKEVASLAAHDAAVRGLAFSPDGAWFASAADDSRIKVWDVAARKEKAEFTPKISAGPDAAEPITAPKEILSCLAISPDGKTVATSGAATQIWLWDVATGEQRAVLTGCLSTVTSLAFAPDGKALLSGSADKTLKRWNVKTASK